MPFLPGDSLLFAAGALTVSLGVFKILPLWVLMVIAAIAGDTVNYWIGHFLGWEAFESDNKFLKKKYLHEAHAFYEKHGSMAIILARFVPIVRTFAPFVAGIGEMEYKKFLAFNVLGGLLWVSLMLFSGYFFGNIPVIKNNFHYVVLGIMLFSVVPIVFEIVKDRIKKVSKK